MAAYRSSSLGGTCDHAITSCPEPTLVRRDRHSLGRINFDRATASPRRTNRSTSRQNSGALPYTGQANGCSLHEELPADRADFRKIKGSRCACGGRAALTSINIGFRGGAFCFAEGATSIWETRCKRSRCTSRETPCCGGTKGKE